MPNAFETLLPRLRAIAEPTRLRLLAVLARGEFSVSELTAILGQSQPRVSRHLKLLDDCGLLERFREQHWIYYRVAADTEGGQLVRQLLELLDPADPVLSGDEQRLRRVLDERAGRGVVQEDGTAAATDELLPLLATEFALHANDSLLYFGSAPEELLAGLGRHVRRVVGMNPSRRIVQRTRALLHSAGLTHCLLQQGELAALPQPSRSFDVVVVDRVLAGAEQPALDLSEAVRVLRDGGRLLIVEDFDALERRMPEGNPLVLLRAWLADAGLACDRLYPFDVSGAHLLLAVATAQPEVAAA